MAFGLEMEVERPETQYGPARSPITLAAFSRSDLSQFPPIDSEQSAPVRKYVTQDFIREARTFQDKIPTEHDYFNELKNDANATWWGMWIGDRLVGFTGYRAIETSPDTGIISAKSRMVIMNADYFRQGIGRAAGLGRLQFAIEHDEIDTLTANVDVANVDSYNLIEGEGYACKGDVVVKQEDPPRHQMQLWRPDIAIELRGEPQPIHGDSWAQADDREVRAMLDAERLVHI